ncbi:MAG: ATP-binding cassette domain-containing protein [Candidatus Aenigmarchaeota archaeon]|nr:ATP-binding cassette domain-containing protein [Candidatus Aenigmarchaeota archaeon]
MTTAVDIRDISKKFKRNGKEFYALKDISFKIKEGEIFGLLGPNGAGKSTLINILTTILLPDKGTAKIFGYDIIEERQKILETINSVSGETRFHWLLKVKNILKFYLDVYDIPSEKKKDRIEYLAEMLEMKHLLNRTYRTLSTGEKMRVTLVKSLLNHPKLVLYDEPTVGLDPDIAVKTRELVKEINKREGTTILLTSHYMGEVEELCKRIAFIDGGRISDIGTVKKLKSKKFPTYRVKIGVSEIKNKELLKKHGFKMNRKTLTKELENNEDPSELIRFLVKNNYDVISFETEHPTLEDYFLKMTRDRK